MASLEVRIRRVPGAGRQYVFKPRPNGGFPPSPTRSLRTVTATDESELRGGLSTPLCHEAVNARDQRFDGVFFVAITSTGIYCRPVCPSRRADPGNRRFFASAAAAERSGFRPCLRCRPELAPGRALMDAVPRLAAAAADRIAAGALNARPLGSLASELHVSERHLRRAVRRELGVSPAELAQTHRLLMAKRLLADTALDMSRIAFASGFQSLRRFNALVRERYGMSPTALRQAARSHTASRRGADPEVSPTVGYIALTLAYRPPFAWTAMLEHLVRHATPGIECVNGRRYGRTIRIGGHTGVVVMEDDPSAGAIAVRVSPGLVPVLMPLLGALRRFLDLDAEPSVIDARLAESGLGAHVESCAGLRLPGAVDGFEFAFLTLVHDANPHSEGRELAASLVRTLGEPVDHGVAGLDVVTPDPGRVAETGEAGLTTLGLPPRHAAAIASLARAVAGGSLLLSPGCDPADVRRALLELDGIEPVRATRIVMHALSWPDAFPADDPALQRAAGASGPTDLLARAEDWRPWRAYAALHLRRSPLPIR